MIDRVDAQADHTANLRDIVTANAYRCRFQAGFGDDADGVHDSIRPCVATGVAGYRSRRVGQVDRPLYDRDAAIDRVRAARAAIDASGAPVC